MEVPKNTTETANKPIYPLIDLNFKDINGSQRDLERRLRAWLSQPKDELVAVPDTFAEYMEQLQSPVSKRSSTYDLINNLLRRAANVGKLDKSWAEFFMNTDCQHEGELRIQACQSLKQTAAEIYDQLDRQKHSD